MCNVEYLKGFSGGSMVKILPGSAGDTGDANLIPGLGRPLKEKMATHSSIHAQKVQETEESGWLQASSVQSLSRVRLFVTPRITARQAFLSITNSQSLLKLMSIESVISSSVVPFSSCPQSLPASESFPMSQLFA